MNHFRNTLQALEAIRFIETRDHVQAAALEAISRYLAAYEVETRGVYIQDVTFPEDLVNVLTRREIANQEKATFEQQKDAQTVRVDLEKARGTADMQAELAKAQVSVDINRARARARMAEADGEAAYVRVTGEAEGSRLRSIGVGEAAGVEALGLAKAKGYQGQVESLGSGSTAAVAIANALSEGILDIMPEVLVTGGGGAIEGLADTFMRSLTEMARPNQRAVGGAGLQPRLMRKPKDRRAADGPPVSISNRVSAALVRLFRGKGSREKTADALDLVSVEQLAAGHQLLD